MVGNEYLFVKRYGVGFSLIELLVVLSVILILMSGAISFWSFDRSSRNLKGGVRTLQGIARRAHIHSNLEGIPTRLLVERDVRFPDDYLRQIATVEWVDGEWRLFGSIGVLPEGVFAVTASFGDSGDADGVVSLLSESEVSFSADIGGRGLREYVFWEFGPGGNLDISSNIDFSATDIDAGQLAFLLSLASGLMVNGVLEFDEVDASAGVVGISIGLDGKVYAVYSL